MVELYDPKDKFSYPRSLVIIYKSACDSKAACTEMSWLLILPIQFILEIESKRNLCLDSQPNLA